MPHDAQTPRVAVAVVSWNTRDLLDRCLRSLEPEARRGAAEVWVVDNASTDGSPDLVRDRFDWVRLVASDENLGFGRAVNLVARQTASEWVAPANADVALHPGALDAMLAAGERDRGAGAIAPRLVLPDGSTQHSVYAFPSIPFALVLHSGAARLSRRLGDRMQLIGYWDTERNRRVPWAIAAFLLVRRTAWDEIGGFDERQWMYAEDLDLGWRLRRAGWATRYVPEAAVDHESSASTTQAWGVELAPVWQRSTYGFMARRLGMPRTLAFAAIYVAGTGIRWLLGAPGALLRGGAARDEHRALRRWVMVHVRVLRDRGKVLDYS
ncbi:MAG TPA: glycosyltransferase family 2 protein [Thermoleophilaceae bacterium]|nr:glycosyltransferase family 2 protein [Thermoleophilaceae bacterium]